MIFSIIISELYAAGSRRSQKFNPSRLDPESRPPGFFQSYRENKSSPKSSRKLPRVGDDLGAQKAGSRVFAPPLTKQTARGLGPGQGGRGIKIPVSGFTLTPDPPLRAPRGLRSVTLSSHVMDRTDKHGPPALCSLPLVYSLF